jgi:hypothetical protein
LVVPTDAVQGAQGEQFVYVVHLENSPEAGKADGPEAEKGAEPVKAKKKEEPKKDKKAQSSKPEEKDPAKGVQTIEKRAITVGYTRPDYSQIDAGVSEGEVIAISGLERLENGKKVRVLETQEAEV